MIYLFGIPVWALVGGMSLGAAALSSLVFLPGDLIKAGLTAVVARGTQRAYPDAVPAVHQERVRSAGGADPSMPVARHVLTHAAGRPSRLALCGPQGELTYAGLAERIDGAARHLRGRGVGPGALVGIALADPVELLTAVLAADLAGATPLVGEHAWDRERWDQITGEDLAAVLDEPLPHPAGPAVPAEDRPGDLAWACFSSGSTGRPRAVVRTRASWTGSYPHLNALTGIGPDDVVLVPGPLVSSLYAFAALHALATGATAVVPGRWPGRSLAACLARSTVVHVVPHRLPDVLQQPGSLRVAVVGGAALGPRRGPPRPACASCRTTGPPSCRSWPWTPTEAGCAPFPAWRSRSAPAPASRSARCGRARPGWPRGTWRERPGHCAATVRAG
ncbi:AMP-binding protein [Nonomuraea thailandensis]